MFTIQLKTPTGTCYLRGTVWTFQDARDRATVYPSLAAATAALAKAKPFMAAKTFKAATITPEI